MRSEGINVAVTIALCNHPVQEPGSVHPGSAINHGYKTS